jgi:hypothetical protein
MPTKRNWNDIKMLTATLAVATTLGLWNLFGTVNKQNTSQKVAGGQNSAPSIVENTAQPAFYKKVLLGGQAPSQTVIFLRSRSNQPAPVTQTRSS